MNLLSSLDRKLARDLWRMRSQVFAIGLVIASGVAMLVMSLGTLEALRETAAAFYERNRFAHVFASLERAPERMVSRIRAIPGVQTVETRVSELAILDVPGFDEPVTGQLLSVPEHGQPILNTLTLRRGRPIRSGHPDEAVINEAFSEAHGIGPGDRLHAIVNGRRRELEVVGVALSPEFVYAIGPDVFIPDNERFGVVWMGRRSLAAAYDLEGAFNDVSLTLRRGARVEEVIVRLDSLLASKGGIGAYDRDDQVSNWFLSSEIDQLSTMAWIMPTVFLSVAAFLTNMVLSRLIATERAEIGLLRAFGYSSLAVAWHYAKLVLVVVVVGVALGAALGWWFGFWTTALYAEFYRFPYFFFRPSPLVFLLAAGVSAGAAALGTFRALRRAALLPPAEAMRPPAPPSFRHTELGGLVTRAFDQPTRMLLRAILRWPSRSLTTSVGIGMGVALVVVALHWEDAIHRLADVEFGRAQRQDVTVGLAEARSASVLEDLRHLPGVLHAEPARFAAARLHSGARSRREGIQGVVAGARLRPVYDAEGGRVPVPPDGLLVSTKLAKVLDLQIGDYVTVEILERGRPVREVPVAGLVETYLGTPVWMEFEALNRLLGEASAVSTAHLRVDRRHEAELFRALKEVPQLASVGVRRAALSQFYETLAESMLIFISFFALFAYLLTFGVAYNSTRIALSERARELATLRVLGLRASEVAYILLGQVGLLAWLGLPLGCLAGMGLAWLITDRFETELYRVPLVIEPSTFGIAVAVAVLAVVASGFLVLGRLRRLDLIAVLKTRE